MVTTGALQMTGCLTLKLRTPLYVCGVERAPAGTVLQGYRSPGYDRAPGWLVLVGGKVVELFVGQFEMLVFRPVQVLEMPEAIRAYTTPDHRGFTTMPYRADLRQEWHG